jgi:hypothetical protein
MRSLLYFISACIALYLIVLVFFSPNSKDSLNISQNIASLGFVDNSQAERFQQLKEAEELLDSTVRRDKIHFLPAPKILEVSSRADQLKLEQESLDGEEQLLLSQISGIEVVGSNASRFAKSAGSYQDLNSEQLVGKQTAKNQNEEESSVELASLKPSMAETMIETKVENTKAQDKQNTNNESYVNIQPKSVAELPKVKKSADRGANFLQAANAVPAYNFDTARILEQKSPKPEKEKVDYSRIFSIKIASEALRPAPTYDSPPIRVLKKGSNIKFLYARNSWAYVQDEDGNRSWLRTNAIN